MDLKGRLSDYCERKNISISRFEKMAGLSNGYFNQVKKRPSLDKLQSMGRAFPDLNTDWLMTGEGEMLNGSNNVVQYGSNVNTTGDNNHIEQSALLDKALGEISELRKALVDALQVNQRQAERLLDILQTYGNMSTFGGKADNK
jgi:hypothetical protein